MEQFLIAFGGGLIVSGATWIFLGGKTKRQVEEHDRKIAMFDAHQRELVASISDLHTAKEVQSAYREMSIVALTAIQNRVDHLLDKVGLDLSLVKEKLSGISVDIANLKEQIRKV